MGGKKKQSKNKSSISKYSLGLLKKRSRKKNQISLYQKKWKYNVFLIPSRLKKSFVNMAGSLQAILKNETVTKKKRKKASKSYQGNQIFSKVFRLFSSALMITGVFVFLLGVGVVGVQRYSAGQNPVKQVAGVNSSTIVEQSDFDKWTLEKIGFVTVRNEDSDGDGLTNYEEFLLDSNPNSKYSCNPQKTDVDLVLEFIHPGTCQPVDMEDEAEVKEFSQVVNIEAVKNNFYESLTQEDEQIEEAQLDTVKDAFEVETLEELNGVKASEVSLEEEEKRTQQKKEYLVTIEQIDAYMQQNRSLEPYDRNYDIPVSGAVYLQVSEQYDMPLKYVMAIAQRESRFGTDRYSNEGFLTRPGQYENIVAMGLDDSGNNMSFGSWEGSLEALGKWYRRFDDAGVDDCRKWRIYNPNGDYCERINQVVNEFEYFIANN